MIFVKIGFGLKVLLEICMWTVCRIYTTRISKKNWEAWWNGLKFCGCKIKFYSCKIWDRFNFVVTWDLIFDLVKRSQISWLQNMGLFQILIWHVKTVSNFAAAKIETVLTCQVSNSSWHAFWILTWWNGLKFCGCKISDRFKFCHDIAKQSQILWLQNMGLFWFLTCLGETVSNLAAAKYGTISNFVVTWDLNFWVDETVSNFATAKYWTVSNFNLTCQNGLKFCICKIWDRFKFCHNMAKRSQIMWLQNMGPFQIVSWCAWIGLKFCSCKIRNHFHFWRDMMKR